MDVLLFIRSIFSASFFFPTWYPTLICNNTSVGVEGRDSLSCLVYLSVLVLTLFSFNYYHLIKDPGIYYKSLSLICLLHALGYSRPLISSDIYHQPVNFCQIKFPVGILTGITSDFNLGIIAYIYGIEYFHLWKWCVSREVLFHHICTQVLLFQYRDTP